MLRRLFSAQIFKNASALLLVQILNPVLGMAFVVTLARLDGAAGLGEYTFAISVVWIFEVMGGLGIREYIIREIGKHAQSWRTLMTTSLVLGTLAAVLAQAAMIAGARVMGYDTATREGLLIISFSLLPSVLCYVLSSFHYAFDRMTVVSNVTITDTAARVGLGLLVILLGGGMKWLLATFVISRALAATLAFVLNVRHLGLPGRVWNSEVFKALLRNSPTFAGMAVLAAIYWRVDVLMLSRLLDNEAVGQYAAAYRIMFIFSMVGTSLITTIYPTMTRMFHHARSNFNMLIDKGVQYAFMVLLPIAVLAQGMSGGVIALFFGEGFAGAAAGLRILMWVILPLVISQLLASALIAAGLQKLDLRVNLWRLVWNVVLNYCLIVKLGVSGACLATLISCVASVGVQLYYLRNTVKLNLTISNYLKPVLATTVALIAVELTGSWHLVAQGALAVAAYVAALLALRPFNDDDRHMLKCLSNQTAGTVA